MIGGEGIGWRHAGGEAFVEKTGMIYPSPPSSRIVFLLSSSWEISSYSYTRMLPTVARADDCDMRKRRDRHRPGMMAAQQRGCGLGEGAWTLFFFSFLLFFFSRGPALAPFDWTASSPTAQQMRSVLLGLDRSLRGERRKPHSHRGWNAL